jgi:Zn ribbon nucleic-acid-binding protein
MGNQESVELRCPTCGHALERLGSREIGGNDADSGRAQAYWCPSGCRGGQPDGMFEFVECPMCGSHDTTSGPCVNGMEEVECNACGAIARMQRVA